MKPVQPNAPLTLSAAAPRSIRRFWIVVALALAVHATLGILAGSDLTVTHDEFWHLPVGLLNLRTGRFHYDNLNPPLCREIAAIPLWATSARIGPQQADDPLSWGALFMGENAANYTAYFAAGRTMIVLLSVFGGLATACWARELWGDGAGCLAAVFWAFEPNLLAHGSLVTTDMGAAAFFVFTLYVAWKLAARPRWKLSVLFGIVLGLAQLVKFTSLILYPLSLAILLMGRESNATSGSNSKPPENVPEPGRARLLVMWCVALGLSLVVLNAGYLFRGSFSLLAGHRFQSAVLRHMSESMAAAGRIPVPLPRDYLEGLDHQRQVMEQKHPVFLDGAFSEEGFPRYYLWAMFYKLPHPEQLLCLVVLLCLAMPGRVVRRLRTQAVVLLPAVAMVVVAESSPMQLGIRYVLPALPFLILFASQAARWFDFRSFPLRSAAVMALSAWMMLSVRYHPEHLSYFNELAGGPLGGREHLLDSNLDWGQDLGQLKHFLDADKIEEIGLAYFGTVPPSALGINYHVPPSRQPRTGRFAISVNFEQGRPHWLRTPKGEIRPVDIGEFAYFSFFQPTARIGYSIDVFELTERDVAAWQSAVRQSGRQRTAH